MRKVDIQRLLDEHKNLKNKLFCRGYVFGFFNK